jgi:hypothetical protein
MLSHLLALQSLGGPRTDDLVAVDLEAGEAQFDSPRVGVPSSSVVIPAGRLTHGFAVYPAGPMRARIDRLQGPLDAETFGVEFDYPAMRQMHLLQPLDITAGAIETGRPEMKRSFVRNDNAFLMAVA